MVGWVVTWSLEGPVAFKYPEDEGSIRTLIDALHGIMSNAAVFDSYRSGLSISVIGRYLTVHMSMVVRFDTGIPKEKAWELFNNYLHGDIRGKEVVSHITLLEVDRAVLTMVVNVDEFIDSTDEKAYGYAYDIINLLGLVPTSVAPYEPCQGSKS